MTFVPRSLGELYDLLSAMSISGPKMESPLFPEQTVQSCFSQVMEALDNLQSKLGREGHGRLAKAAREAQTLYGSGGYREGVNLIQHMAEYIRLKKYETEEPVIDEGRFEPRS